MILVAATGPIGCGKTFLLSRLAQWAKEQNKTVDGFLAIAHHRRTSGRGADGYVLQWISSGEEMLFVRRDDSRCPPYEINRETFEKVALWATEIAKQPKRSLLILDEFGPFEAQGSGHMRYWQSLRAANPEVVVISVRDTLVENIQSRLGLPFDAIIDATSPKALHRLQAVVDQHPDWIRAGQFGATAGGFEATVGSALHGANVPMRGLFLSTVQSLLMMYAGDRMRVRSRVVWVPFISAGLKALSPSGSRLRPMLAISIQGILFNLATSILGWNVGGIFIGGWLVGAWAASQGILLQYLFIGAGYFQAIDTVIRWLVERLQMTLPGVTMLILLWISFWGFISAVVTLFAWLRRHNLPNRLSVLLSKGTHGMVWNADKPTFASAVRHGVHDLVRPCFWVPILIVATIVLAAGSSWEGVMWIVVRAVSVGWVFFSVVRMINPLTLVEWLRRRGLWGPALAFSRAFRRQSEKFPFEKENDIATQDNHPPPGA